MGLLGSLGSVAGTAIGSYFGGPVGGAIGGSIGSGLGNSISSGVSSALDYRNSVKLMEKQYEMQKDLNEYNALNRYPWAVKSLRDANLNPILAATQGQPLAGGSPQYNDVSPATRAIHSAAALQQIEATQAGIDKTKADTAAAKELAAQYSASAAQIKANTAVVLKQLDYWHRNPQMYDIGQAYKSNPIIGTAIGGGEYIGSSARQFYEGLKREMSSTKSAKALRYFRYSDSY